MGVFDGRGKKKMGVPPGTPVYIGDVAAEKIEISIIDYDKNNAEMKMVESVDDCAVYKDSSTVTWINISGVHDIDMIHKVGKTFDIHPLMLEDIVNTMQRPKMEDYDNYIFVIVKMLTYNRQEKIIESEQVSMVVGKNIVITFQEHKGDVFDVIRKRIQTSSGKIRKEGADYLAYSIVDAIVDNYFIILEDVGDAIEMIEDEVEDEDIGASVQQKIYYLKRMLILLRKSVWPLRELLSGLARSESKIISKAVHLYIRDVYDHTIQIIDSVDTYKDMVSSIRDTYMTSLSNRMNSIMKVLTIIATIFIPLTFIAGVYGMNFKYMPELDTKFGYPALLVVMFLVAASMLLFFRRKKWL